MYSTTKTGAKLTPYVVELVADVETDIAALPTHYAPGSTCFVIENSKTYMLNNNKQWKLVQISSGGSGGSSGGTTIEGSLASKEDIDNLFQGG